MTVDSTTPPAIARPKLLYEVRISFRSDPLQSKPSFLRAPNRLICCLLLALVTIATYQPITHAPFLNYDDQMYVTDNTQVRAGLTWSTILWTFRTPKALDWHPISWLSHALDCELFGLNPEAHHTVSVLIHATNAILLFLILQAATGFLWRSLAVSALFALHPINVESVAWIAERKNVLSMFFFLLALAAYGWYARRPSLGRYLAVTAAYVLALMSKAQAITFPFALLLLDYWPLRRLGQGDASTEESGVALPATAAARSFLFLVAEKLPWFALSCVSAVITMGTGTGFSYIVESGSTSNFPAWINLAIAVTGYLKYLGKFFWPWNLALLYPHPGLATSISAAVLSAIVLAAVTAIVLVFRQRRFLFVGWFWFLGTMVPMSGIYPIGPHSMADRYAYLPFLGIFIIVCWGVAELMRDWGVSRAASTFSVAAVLVVLVLALHRQVGFWADNVKLWTHTLAITRNNYTAEEQLGMAFIIQGRPAEAFPHLQRAYTLNSGDPLATLNLATYQQMLGNNREALAVYTNLFRYGARTVAPSLLAHAHSNSGYAHLFLKQYDEARQDFAAALAQQPENSAAWRGLGLVTQKDGDLKTAVRNYQRSVELEPSSIGYLLWAQALERAGNHIAAQAAEIQAKSMTQNPTEDLATVRQLLSN